MPVVLGHVSYQPRVSYADSNTGQVDAQPAWAMNNLKAAYRADADSSSVVQGAHNETPYETPYVFDGVRPHLLLHSILAREAGGRIRANFAHLGLTTGKGRETLVFTRGAIARPDFQGEDAVEVHLRDGRLPIEPIPLLARLTSVGADLRMLASQWNQLANRPAPGSAWEHGHLPSTPKTVDRLKLWCPSLVYEENEDGFPGLRLSYPAPGHGRDDWPVDNCYYHDGREAWLNPSLIQGNITALPHVGLDASEQALHKDDGEIHPQGWHQVYMRRKRDKTYTNSKGESRTFVGNHDGVYGAEESHAHYNPHYRLVPALSVTFATSRKGSAANNFNWLKRYPLKPHDELYSRYFSTTNRVPRIKWGLEVLLYPPRDFEGQRHPMLAQAEVSQELRHDALTLFPTTGAFLRRDRNGQRKPPGVQSVQLAGVTVSTSDRQGQSIRPNLTLARGFHLQLGQSKEEAGVMQAGLLLPLPHKPWAVPSLLHSPLELHAVYMRSPDKAPASSMALSQPAVRDMLLADFHDPRSNHSSLIGLLRADPHRHDDHIEMSAQQLYSSVLVRPRTEHDDYKLVFFVTLAGEPIYFGDNPHCALKWTRHERAKSKIYYSSGLFQ